MRRVGPVAKRVAVFVAVVVALQIVLGWAASEAPWLAWLLMLVAVALLARTLWRVVRSDRPVKGAAILVAMTLAGWAVAFAVAAVIGTDPPTADAGTAEPELALPVADLSFVPTVGTTPPAPAIAEEAADPVAPEADPQPVQATSTLGEMVVRAEGGNAVLELMPVDVAVLPAEVIVVSRDRPARPIRFAAADGWVAEGAGTTAATITWDGAILRVTIGDGAGDAFAVIEPGPVRLPGEGYLTPAGDVVALSSVIAGVEAGFVALTAEKRAYVASLLGRQLTTGEYRLRDEATGGEVVFSVDRPRFSQTSADGSSGIYETGEGRFRCDASGCVAADDIVLPVDVAALVAADPASLDVAPAPLVDGAQGCVEVIAAPGGASTGVACWDDAGRPLFVERAEGARLTLVLSSGEVDPGRIDPPAEAG